MPILGDAWLSRDLPWYAHFWLWWLSPRYIGERLVQKHTSHHQNLQDHTATACHFLHSCIAIRMVDFVREVWAHIVIITLHTLHFNANCRYYTRSSLKDIPPRVFNSKFCNDCSLPFHAFECLIWLCKYQFSRLLRSKAGTDATSAWNRVRNLLRKLQMDKGSVFKLDWACFKPSLDDLGKGHNVT